MSLSGLFKLHHWPGFTFGLCISTFLLSYVIAVLDGHVYGFFPYISDSGAMVPESCIFGQLMNIAALSMGITLYIRYRQVNFDIISGHNDVPRKWNTMAFWLIGVVSLGMSLTANFQENEIFVIHLLGAFMAFGIGTFYFTIQTRISFGSINKLNGTNSNYYLGRKTLYFRLFLVLFMYPLLFTNGMCGYIALNEFKGKTIIWWTEEDGGFKVRLASTFTEWILAIFLLLYILTFTNEFKSLTFQDFTFAYKNSTSQSEPARIIS